MNIKRRIVLAYDDAFYARFPLIFADVIGEKRESVSPLTEWGVECGAGWRKLLERVCEKIEAEVANLPERERPSYRVSQIKQKLGSLRLYMSRETDAITKAIRVAEDESLATCETCGDAGSLGKKPGRFPVEVSCSDKSCRSRRRSIEAELEED